MIKRWSLLMLKTINKLKMAAKKHQTEVRACRSIRNVASSDTTKTDPMSLALLIVETKKGTTVGKT